MMLKRKYSKDIATLIALISNLALGKYSRRSVEGLSKDTSIEEDEIKGILVHYKSLFRKSSKSNKYSLHIRHALQYESDEDDNKIKPPLETEYITTLINFVSDKAKEEQNWNLQFLLAIGASIVSILIALLALLGKP